MTSPSTPKVVVIGGGSRGLGQALVGDFLARGHIVATFSRMRTPFIQDLQQKIPSGESFFWEQLDSTDHERVKQFVLTVARRYGHIDVLINNAAVGIDGLLALTRSAEI